MGSDEGRPGISFVLEKPVKEKNSFANTMAKGTLIITTL